MRKTIRNVLVLVVGVSGLVLFSLWGVKRAARHEPQFYLQALKAEPLDQEEAGDALERSVLELHEDVGRAGRWQATFTEDQLNGWLASDLPEKFPSLLPRGTREPRIAIDSQSAQIACRYETAKVQTVISLSVDIQMSDQPNQLAVRIRKIRAGVLPVPMKRFLDPITKAAARAEIPVHWSQLEGDPVALVTVPIRHRDYAHPEVYLETIELRDGEVHLAGRTEAAGRALVAVNTPRSAR